MYHTTQKCVWDLTRRRHVLACGPTSEHHARSTRGPEGDTFPGISGSRLPTWRPSRSGNRCPQRRRPQLFGCRDFCTICAPFLHHEMQFQKLCSRRAPKRDDKIRQNTTKSDKTRHDLVPMTFRSKTNPLVVPALAGSAVLDAGRLQTGKTLPGNLNSGSFNPNTEVSSTRGSGESRDSDPCAVHGSGENRPVLVPNSFLLCFLCVLLFIRFGIRV